MATDNTVNLSFKDANEFRDYIGRKEVGDTCRITVDFQITDIGEENVSGVISKPEAEDDDEATTQPSDDSESETQPAMIIMGGKNGRSKATRY